MKTTVSRSRKSTKRFPMGFGKLLEFAWQIYELGNRLDGCFVLDGDTVFILPVLCDSKAPEFLKHCQDVLYDGCSEEDLSEGGLYIYKVLQLLKRMNEVVGRYNHFKSTRLRVSSISHVDISLMVADGDGGFDELIYEMVDSLPFHIDGCRDKTFVGAINGFDVFYNWDNRFIVAPKSYQAKM